MMDIISYIRSWFFNPSEVRRNKRRAPFDDYDTIQTKIRRMSNPIDDDWLSSTASHNARRYSSLNCTKSSSLFPTIILDDDDDDVIEVSKPKDSCCLKKTQSTVNYTSTPSENRSRQIMRDTSSCIFDRNRYVSGGGQKQACNGTKYNDQMSPILSSIKDVKYNLNFPSTRQPLARSPVLDQTFRLDEKMKYKELLEKAAPNISTGFKSPNDSFSKYHTPTGKLFNFGSTRGRQMLDACRTKPKVVDSIDLTSSKFESTKPKLSTKETIIKILDDFDSEPVTVKDSDSDIEILPSSPSPTPDIKVDRVNSLKVVIDTSEASHSHWLEELTKRHRDSIEQRQKAIKDLTEQKKKFAEINDEIRIKTLRDHIRRCLSLKEVILPVEVPSEEPELPPLSEEQYKIVEQALKQSGFKNDVLVTNFGLNVTRRDMLTLAGLNWLNDEIINFYMNLIIERGKNSKWPKAYAMNTFFYPKLIRDGPASLRRWTRKVDIFTYDIITIPIHLGMHWCMAVIDFRSKMIKYYDSMGASNNKCLEALLNYLVEEHKDKKKSTYDVSEWKLENVRNIPQQMNGSDCGMFACTFAEFLTRDAKLNFNQEDMPYLRRKMVVEIMTSKLLIS